MYTRSTIQYLIVVVSMGIWMVSCSTLEKASTHGLSSGYYTMKPVKGETQKVYLDIKDDTVSVHHVVKAEPERSRSSVIDLKASGDVDMDPVVFRKQSLDIDITSILLKYRPSVSGLPAQLTTDINFALYAGWRFDSYHMSTGKDPLGKTYVKTRARGFDFGFFAGAGAASVSPLNTLGRVNDEYSSMILQGGVAGFVETNFASFGVAVGVDHLLSKDRQVWVYQNKPWVGFIIGIALN